MKRLEQVAALVVAAGLAIVSYWLFFSWAGGDRDRRPDRERSLRGRPGPLPATACCRCHRGWRRNGAPHQR
ncbi:hypothetical protein AAF143_09015 [Cyanobium sp. ATX-6F1]